MVAKENTSTRARRRHFNKGEKKSYFVFCLPDDLRKQIKVICNSRSIEMAEYIRECIAENNKKYRFLIKNIF